MSNKITLNIEGISKQFSGPSGAKIKVLDDINFTTGSENSKGKFVSIIASFSSGKSTLLKIIAGLESPDSGQVKLNDKNFTSATGEIAYIPENPSSFPWMSVSGNINFALKNTNEQVPVKNIIEAVELGGYENHFPDNKSLGFRFRISLARALAAGAKVVLLDDPFRRMKSETKDEIYELLRKILDKYGIIFILATPNITEAIYLSNNILLMKKNPGKIIDEIELDAETAGTRNLNRRERFLSLRNEIESKFVSIGENLQTEVHF